MRKKLLQILLVPVIILVCSDVAMSRGPDRSPPGIESKMFVADLEDCQLQDQVALVPALVPAQDTWHPNQQAYQVRDDVPDLPPAWPETGTLPPDRRIKIYENKKNDSGPLLEIRRSTSLYRWGEFYHPLRE